MLEAKDFVRDTSIRIAGGFQYNKNGAASI
jgi:hypothetical protein